MVTYTTKIIAYLWKYFTLGHTEVTVQKIKGINEAWWIFRFHFIMRIIIIMVLLWRNKFITLGGTISTSFLW